MSHHDESFALAPDILSFEQNAKDQLDGKVKLIILGQGALAVKNTRSNHFTIHFAADENKLSFHINKKEAKFTLYKDDIILRELVYPNIKLDIDESAIYWFSIDGLSNTIKYGVGEVRESLTLIELKFDESWLSNEPETLESWLLNVDTLCISEGLEPIELYKDPIVYDPSLKIISADQVSIEDIARNNYVTPSDLTPGCQKLYNNISGANFSLNTSDFPDFVDAIEHSIRTEGLWCHEKLLSKSKEFGEESLEETYLRITLGANQGESPGIPYVVEIWPPGHYSPIHDHGGANAIIRVLHGEINVNLYPMLSSLHTDPFMSDIFRKDDITWISPRYNQFHKLENTNRSGPSCITIQCYLYGDKDTTHYRYFDYLNEKEINLFTPNSDADYITFKSIIREEWENYKR